MTTISSTSTGTVNFSGLASSIDTDSIVDSLIEVESAPITTMENEQTYLETKRSTYTKFDTLLDNFYSAVEALNDESDLHSFEVTNNGSDSFSVSTTSLAEAGTYSVQVVSLAQQQKDISSSYVADTDTTTVSGTLQFGEESLEYEDVTLSDLVTQINEGSYGVTARVIDDGSGSGYRLMFTADSAGEEVEIVGTGGIEIDTATNGHTIEGTKAHIVVDGVDYYSTTNTMTNALKGATITLLAKSDDADTVQIESDTENVISTQLQKMVDAYNKINTFIDSLSESDPTLANTMKSVQRSLRNYLTSSSFLSLGIQTDWETGELTFDSDTFSEAYEDNAETVITSLLGDDDSEGVMSRLDDYLSEQVNSTSGFLASKEKTIDKQVADLDDKIDAMTTRLEKRRATLEAQFSAMETLLSSLNSQGDFLTSFFESYSSS
jgi:flagellar hook-associated protein 2